MKRARFKSRGKPMRSKSKKVAAYEESPEGLEAALQRRMRRMLPCVICDAFGLVQMSPTTCHHWIMGRGGNLKTPCNQSLPLCDGHHQGNFDKSKIAIHREPDAWREAYGEDREYIEVTQDRVERLEL